MFYNLITNYLVFDVFVGILAGLASGFLNHPMDTIKLRIQTECDEADEIKEMLSRDSKDNFTYFAENNDLLHDNKNEMFYDDKYEKYSGFRNSNSNLKNLKKQKINHNLISMGMLIVKKDGISALFSGIGAAMYSTIFSSAFFCIIYEMIKRESTI